MNKQATIAFITDSYWPTIGGIENAVQMLVRSLPETFSGTIYTHGMNQNSKLLISRYIHKNGSPNFDPDGNQIRYIQTDSAHKMLLLPLLLWNTIGFQHFRSPRLYDSLYTWYRAVFGRKLRSQLKDFALIHNFSTSWPARLIAEIGRAQNIPVLHTPAIHFGRWGDSPAQMQSYTEGQAVTCFTEHLKRQFLHIAKGLNDKTIYLIPPVIKDCSLASQVNCPIEKPFMLFLGRREEHKGLPLLIDAFNKTKQSVKLVIAGPGPKIMHSNNSIIDCGEVTDELKLSLLNNCEFLAVPTRDESFGIVFTEAMSCSKPCVALDIAPVNEIVQNQQTGLLVPPGNLDMLAEVLQRFFDDKNLVLSMGNKAKIRFNTMYSSHVTTKRFISLYSEILSSIVFNKNKFRNA